MRAFMCALLVAGCDVVWSIDHVDHASDAGDAPTTISCVQDDHDEDGDGFPDPCDRCPGIADDQADTDGDSLGDACDPSGTTSERVELFISFADPLQKWNLLVGDWHPSGDDYVYTSVALDLSGTTLYTGVVPPPPFWIEYHYRVDAIDAQVSSLAVLVDTAADGKGVSCGFDRQLPVTDTVRAAYSHMARSNESPIMTIVPGTYRVMARYDRTTSRVDCSLRSDDNTTSGATFATATPPMSGGIALRSFKVGATVQWIAIYKTY